MKNERGYVSYLTPLPSYYIQAAAQSKRVVP